LLYLDRYDIRQVPLQYRKEVLRNAFGFHGSLRFTEHTRLKARTTTDGRARRDGKVSSQKMVTACTCLGERAIGSNSSASKSRSSAATRRALGETGARRLNRIHRVDARRQAATPSIPCSAG
jgi:ATP-dependent DNA ligase